MFFDEFSRFCETSQTGSTARRLNRRHAAIIKWNADALKGARVLDLASHDGRWSAAALQAGARHVTAVEPRTHLVNHARKTFAHYGFTPERYDLRHSGVEELQFDKLQVDVVLLLGFLYHVNNHFDLVRQVSETGAKCVVVDTLILPETEQHPKWPNVVAFRDEDTQLEWNLCNSQLVGKTHLPVGIPSRGAIYSLFGYFGFVGSEYEWTSDINANGADPELYDYVAGERSTYRMVRP